MPSISVISGARPAIGPPAWPPKMAPRPAACSSEAEASITTPTRQLPSDMTCGVSATTTTVLSLTSSPSTSPLSTWNASTTRHRSWSAGIVSPDVVQGHTMSHEQFSKYVPSSRQAIGGPPSPWERAKVCSRRKRRSMVRHASACFLVRAPLAMSAVAPRRSVVLDISGVTLADRDVCDKRNDDGAERQCHPAAAQPEPRQLLRLPQAVREGCSDRSGDDVGEPEREDGVPVCPAIAHRRDDDDRGEDEGRGEVAQVQRRR